MKFAACVSWIQFITVLGCPVDTFFNYFSLFNVPTVNQYLVNQCNCSSWNKTHSIVWKKKIKEEINCPRACYKICIFFYCTLRAASIWFDTTVKAAESWFVEKHTRCLRMEDPVVFCFKQHHCFRFDSLFISVVKLYFITVSTSRLIVNLKDLHTGKLCKFTVLKELNVRTFQ